MSSAPIKRLRWGLRTRLLIYTSGVIGLTLAAAFLWSVYNLRSVLSDRNDAFLRHELSEFLGDSAEIGKNAGETEDPLDEFLHEAKNCEEAGLYVVLKHNGATDVFPQENNAEKFAKAVGDGPFNPDLHTLELPGIPAGVRVIGRELPIHDNTLWTVVLGLPLAETENTLTTFIARLGAGGAAFLVVAAVGGLFLTRQAMQPVANSIAAARRLNPADLTTRLPRTGVGDELDLLAGTFNDLLDRLARYHAQIVQFTADASHELRGPLSAMRAAAEIALQQPRSPEEYRDFLSSLGEQCHRLSELVNNLLLLAKADAGQIELQQLPVDLAEVVTDSVETYRPLAEEKGVSLQWAGSAPVICRGDRMRLLQLAMNLIDNAIKFTPAAGNVIVRLESTESSARLTIDDTGIGIATDRLPRIFERFYQADESRSKGGSGLGLSICRWVVTAHGGTIEARLRPELGMSFQVTIPLAKTEKIGSS